MKSQTRAKLLGLFMVMFGKCLINVNDTEVEGKQEAAEDILGGSTKLLTFVRLWVALILADCLK